MPRCFFPPIACGLVLFGACGGGGGPTPDAGDAADDVGIPDTGSDSGPPMECTAAAGDFPEPVVGRCQTVVDDSALLLAGDDGEGGFILPGARRVTRVGRYVELPGFPMAVSPVPGTRLAVVTDGGVDDEQLSVIDLDTGTVVDQRAFLEHAPDPGESLFLGLAISSDGRRLYASGGGNDLIYRYDLDPATGALTDRPPIELPLAPGEGYVSAVRLLSDDRTLVAVLLFGDAVLVWDTETDTEVRRIPLETDVYPYDIVVAPDERSAWVSEWNGFAVVPLDLTAGTAGMPIAVGKNPEGLALSPDGTRLVVAASDSDSLAVVDLTTGMVTETIWIAGEDAPRGASPSAGAFDGGGRLHVVSAGDNAIDVYEDRGAGYERVGRIPTMWYPTDVRVLGDGTVLVVNGKHEGTGPSDGTVDITKLVGGSLQIVDPADITDAELSRWELEVAGNNDRATRFNRVECPDGADYDFPIPLPGTGPSTVIRHVVMVIRENKTYDAYLGNLTRDGAPYGNGDPDLTLLPPEETDMVHPNTHELARVFTIADNFYSQAEQSVQGHVWTTLGRTTDFIERSWLTTWGRGYWFVPPQGVSDPLGYPEEGAAFEYFIDHGVTFDNYGEVVSARGTRLSPRYPGLVFNLGVSDRERAEYLRGQIQDGCRLAGFTYALMPRDHTRGRDPGAETPRSMIADNDEGVGLLVEAISHSTFWPETVIFVLEDDPQNGGDHVDNHRAPLHVISPWARRGHVMSVHANEASIYRTIQLIMGIDRPLSASWANAAPLYDAFTSSPDYTPYEHVPRAWPVEMNPDDGSAMARRSQSYDWSRPDEQEGLPRMLWEHFHGRPAPWPERMELPDEADDDRR